MMRRYCFNEDTRLPKLPVRFSDKLTEKIEDILFYNRFEIDSLKQWLNELEGLVGWVSNPVIAWDNHNDFIHYDDEETYIENYGILFKIITDKDRQGTERNFVYIIDIVLNLQNYNLNVPPYLYENEAQHGKRRNFRLTEVDLCRMVRNCLNEILNKLGTKEYNLESEQIKPQNVPDIILQNTLSVIRSRAKERSQYSGDSASSLQNDIGESQQRSIFHQCVREVLSEERRKIGEYEVIEGPGIVSLCWAPSIKQFGMFYELRMYYSKAHTYCLHLRKENDKGFFCEIVPAPELGENKTKYVPRHLSEIPSPIRQDALQAIRAEKMWRNNLS